MSVNGVAIAARRHRARDAAPSGRRRRSTPGQPPRARWSCASCCCRRRAALGFAAEPLRGRRGPPRDRRGGADPRPDRARGRARPTPDEATCRRYYEQNRRASAPPTSIEAAHILIAARRMTGRRPTLHARERAERRLVIAAAQRTARFAELARANSFCPSAASAAISARSRPAQTTPEFEQALRRPRAGRTSAGAGRDALRLPRHPARPADRGPRAAVRGRAPAHRRISGGADASPGGCSVRGSPCVVRGAQGC